ncbi:MAG: DNA damage-inducible protein D [Proteobacteria bacterium]|nr:DNA damage-inducible protein D [Pseudomonadota bacterium]
MIINLNIIINQLEASKKTTKNGGEYWMARDIQPILGYDRWENFKSVIDKAKLACESSGFDQTDHFRETKKMVSIGSGAMRERHDYFLTRYACYLVAMNGETSKTEVGIAQTYFAVQTRKQEKQDQLTSIGRRIELRERIKNANKKLGEAAKNAGVQKYPIFHAAGYRGLYDMGLADIKKKKGLPPDEDILDRMGRTELAANEFRITQTEDKLVRDGVFGEQKAIDTHRKVGQEVRNTIKKLGGTMPENLPAEPSIKKIICNSPKAIGK